MKPYVAILPGDGIGPEVMAHTLKVAEHIAPDLTFKTGLIGGVAFKETGQHFPKATADLIDGSAAVLFGAVGGPVEQQHKPQWHNCETNSILALRQHLQLNINLRPVHFYPALALTSPLKNERFAACNDFVILRELAGDIYFGDKSTVVENKQKVARDVAEYNEGQIKSIAHWAFKLASKRRNHLISVDKANVLQSSQLWRQVMEETATDYPNVKLSHQLVDNCAMQLILKPEQFDVIVAGNLFGDIISDAASALPGSLGLMPSASFNPSGFGLYEPAGGSAPAIAGTDLANPMAQILSLALMLEHSFQRHQAARATHMAISQTLDDGYRTSDIFCHGTQLCSGQAFTDEVIHRLIQITEKKNDI